MYLKALELRGFKSFPDKTRLEFEKGITAVVGPNGSGKSNISDAVRWVLGEMSPKSLRGSKMEDVIFAGTAKRTQTGFCEVSIIIDNSGGELPNDAEEVKITRKYYRSGDSEYRINDKPSRLKDIHELFLNTGIGREGYSVIGQGKISEVLSQKSDERRHIFEEAAGISKFRYRKNDAQKKLSETDTNLIRLNDIASEISTRLGPLERDAENAKKYLVLADQKKNLEVSIWLDKLSKSDEKTKDLEARHEESKANYEAKQREDELVEAALDGLYNKKQFLNAKAESIRTEISELEEERNRLETLKSLSQNDISHHTERKNALEAEIKLLDGSQKEALEMELEEAKKTCLEKQQVLEKLSEEIVKAESDIEKARADFSDLERRIEESELEIRRKNDVLTELKINEAAEQNSEKSESERREFLDEEIRKATEELEQTYKYHEAANARKLEFENEKKQLMSDLEEEKASLAELVELKESYAKQKHEYAAEYAANSHRREALEKMDALMEGYPGSVKAVLNSGELRGICGPVSRLLTVSGEYVTAIETALGAAVSNIIVEDEECAKAAMRFLKNTNSGRATFLPLTSVNGKTLHEPGIEKNAGYIGVASDLVSFEPKYSDIADYLLGRTVVTDTIDNASFIARKYGFKYKIVSLDGQVINAGGSYTGGSAAFKTGVMSRSSDIAALDKAIDEILKKSKELNEKIAENLEEIQSAEEFIEGLKNDIASADSGLYRAQNDIKLHEEHIESCSGRLKNMHAQLDEFDSEKIKEKLLALTAKRMEAEVELQTAENNSKELNSLADIAYSKLEEMQNALSELRMQKLSAEKDVENSDGVIRSCALRLAENTKKVISLTEEKKAIEEQLSGIAFDIEKNKTDLEEAKKNVEAKKSELTSYIEEATGIEAESTKKREEQKEILRDKEAFFEQMTKLFSSLEQCRSEYDILTAKLFEEYVLTFSEAVALGLPAPEPGAEKELSSIKAKIRALGHINVGAVEEYKETKERYDFMSKQISDLEDAKKSLENVIKRLESDMKRMFAEAVEKINVSFKRIFTELFGGGNADIVITDPENMLESGIEINIQPPGKMVKNISLLSGGEQAFTAIALYFAILEVNPAPFYIFDEIEAALDDVNVNRFAAYVKKNSDTQFIIITHRRGTMEVADTMYGVTMQEKGVSSFLRVNMDDVEKKTGVKL